MEKAGSSVTRRSLFSWVLDKNMGLQLILLAIILVTVFARVLPLEMQKRIINEAIRLRKMDALILYCGLYLAAVVTASGLKFLINYIQAIIGQRTLARLRKKMFHHIIALPLSFFRKTQPGTVVSSLVTEIASTGDFVGAAVAVPVANILTLLAFAGYLFWLNPLLAVVSLSVYPAVLFLVPALQKRANRANKKRVDLTRQLSDRIGESVAGIHEIHGNGAFSIENNKFDDLTDRLEKIRVVWNLYKFATKVTNNFFSNMGPFLIFILGGYLAMNGRLELGSLVAFLSAQEKLLDPWKELIDFYQVYQDTSVKYRRTMEYFDELPEHEMAPKDRKPYEMEGDIQVQNLSMVTDTGILLLEDINFSLPRGSQMALVGFSGSGKSTLAQCIGQLYRYTGGEVYLDKKSVSDLTKQDILANVGFVAQSPFIFSGTIEENLLYATAAQKEADLRPDMPTLDDIIAVLHHTGLFTDVLKFGLNTVLSRDRHADLMERIVTVRGNFQALFGKSLARHVEFYNENDYLFHSSVADNICFGALNEKEMDPKNLANDPFFREFLDKSDLYGPLLELGAEMARQVVDILGDLPSDQLFFEQSPAGPHELPLLKALVEKMRRKNLHQLDPEDQRAVLDLALRFIPGRHNIVGLPKILERLILGGRAMFREKIQKEKPIAVSFYKMPAYIQNRSVLTNIFFGEAKTRKPLALEKINKSIVHLLIEEDLLETIVKIGLEFHAGSKGDKLSGGQRQKIAIGRTFLKSPKIMIMDEATSALDNKSQARIQELLETKWRGKTTLIAVAHRLDIIKKYDLIAVMRAGKIDEMGTYEELIRKKGLLYELEYGRK